MFNHGYWTDIVAVDLPLGHPDGKAASNTAQAFVNAFHPNELKDVKVLYLHAHSPGLLYTKKPVRRLEDLMGMKIGATGLSAKVVEET